MNEILNQVSQIISINQGYISLLSFLTNIFVIWYLFKFQSKKIDIVQNYEIQMRQIHNIINDDINKEQKNLEHFIEQSTEHFKNAALYNIGKITRDTEIILNNINFMKEEIDTVYKKNIELQEEILKKDYTIGRKYRQIRSLENQLEKLKK